MALRNLGALSAELTEWATSDIPRVPTGYSFVDSLTNGGVAPGEVLLLLARSGVGKTFFALNVLNNNAGVPAIFFSLEMHGRYTLQRLAGIHMDIGTSMIENTIKARGHAHAVEQTVASFSKLMVEDVPGRSIGDMLEACDEYEEVFGERPVLVVIDYLELIRSFGMSQVETVDKLAWAVKDFAREADVATLVLHQVKRGVAKRKTRDSEPVENIGQRPVTTADARFGGEMAADFIMGMYRPSLDPELSEWDRKAIEHDIRLQFLKTRTDGGIHPGGVQHFWDERTGRISELRGLL